MRRDELVLRTRQLVEEGERLLAQPSLGALQVWLQRSDDLLATAWGTMDRYHLAWLMVAKPRAVVRGRPMSPGEEAAYVREVAAGKTAALRMSLDAVERQRMPFRGETGGVGAGQGMGELPGGAASGEVPGPAGARGARLEPSRNRRIPLDPGLERRLDEVRRAAEGHAGHAAEPGPPGARRAPRPERLRD